MGGAVSAAAHCAMHHPRLIANPCVHTAWKPPAHVTTGLRTALLLHVQGASAYEDEDRGRGHAPDRIEVQLPPARQTGRGEEDRVDKGTMERMGGGREDRVRGELAGRPASSAAVQAGHPRTFWLRRSLSYAPPGCRHPTTCTTCLRAAAGS
eukprot:3412823-Rhodomonas_salina.1